MLDVSFSCSFMEFIWNLFCLLSCVISNIDEVSLKLLFMEEYDENFY